MTVFLLLALSIIVFSGMVFALEPNGATVTSGTPERASADTPGNDTNAYAGNVTELTITGVSITQTWQGYFGNVSGAITLEDSSGNTMYNWSLTDPDGEIYASKNSTISWTNIQCFNFTANGSYVDESGNGGTTNLYGTNLTILENEFNINPSDVDGVNETFNWTHAGDSHNLFYTANQLFSAGECLSTMVYSANGGQTADQFEEVLLYEPTTKSVVFASLLESTNVNGFDSADHDFEMLVL